MPLNNIQVNIYNIIIRNDIFSIKCWLLADIWHRSNFKYTFQHLLLNFLLDVFDDQSVSKLSTS